MARDGAVVTALLDEQGEPLPGFRAEDADPFSGDDVHHPVTWGRRREIELPTGCTVRLRFHLREASLYAFAFL